MLCGAVGIQTVPGQPDCIHSRETVPHLSYTISISPLVIYKWDVSLLIDRELLEDTTMLMLVHSIHSFNQYLFLEHLLYGRHWARH